MPFNFGGGKTTSRSFGRSQSRDESTSASESGGFSVAGSQSSQSIAFEDMFAKLFSGATDTAFGLDTSTLTTQANQLFNSGAGFINQLGESNQYLEDRVSGQSPVLDEQISALSEDVGRFFSEQINPEITSQAVAGGALGGGRQGVAQGLAAEAAAREFQRGATQLRANDIIARDAAATTLGQQRIQGAAAGLQGITGLADIAQFGNTAALSPFAALSSILGGPTTLTESSSFSTAEDFARAFSESFGESFAENSSTTTSKNVKFGF